MKKMKKMKTQIILTALVIGLSIGIVGVAPAAASWVPYSGAWYSTDGDTNFFSVDVEYLSGSLSSDFNITDEANSSSLTVLSTTDASPATVYFTHSSGKIWASLTDGGMDLDLGTNGYFLFNFNNESYSYKEMENNKQYALKFSSDAQFNVTDAAPVPIPGAALLLASGMLGLGWLKRRSEA
jgi:hypothetical protein